MSADGFLPDAIDLKHHLSDISKARATSPLKGLQKYLGQPGLIQLAGGLPNAGYFPFASLSADVLVSDSFPDGASKDSSSYSWFWNLFSSKSSRDTIEVSVPKYPAHPGDVNLASALQYGMAKGIPQLQEIVKEYSHKVYRPAYNNWTTLLQVGNTDGYSKAFMTLCNPGEAILVSEWTYPSAMASIRPYGLKPVAVQMDALGMRSDDLRKVLSEWDTEARGMPRPHVMYTVPIGQNPTGATMTLDRKKEIYSVCVEYDIIIVEDDPYYILQHGDYVPQVSRSSMSAASKDEEEFLSSLAPSFLRVDYQGRVIRCDTFSKTIAPGCRLGWFTCNPMFAERLERQAETTTQQPSGFAQTMVTALMMQWHYDGYIRWLRGLRLQYAQRRDFFVDTILDQFDVRVASSITENYQQGCLVYEAHLKPNRSIFNEKFSSSGPIFSFVPPSSGMFVWMKLHFENHPLCARLGYKKLEEKLWIALAESNVLVGFGEMFHAEESDGKHVGNGHFRISFSNADQDTMKKAVTTMAAVMKKFFLEYKD